MSDVLKVIRNLKDTLWVQYGNVLSKELSQEEKHLTYYLSDLLLKHGYDSKTLDGATVYSEKATQQAFIAGLRIGRMDQEQIEEEIEARSKKLATVRLTEAVLLLKGQDV